MKKICLVTTYNKTFYLFFYEYIKKLSKNNIVYLVGTDVSKIKKFFPKKIKYYDLKINRRISPLDDLFSLLKLFFFIKKEKIYLTHSIMPKSGLICAIAAYLAKVKYRVHTFTGQVWYQKKKFSKNFTFFF